MKLIYIYLLYLQVYLQSCHALSSCLPPIIDPPSIIRNGDDFDAVPISESQIDPFNYCISLCCNSSIFTCVAFSYNYPQPERSGNCTIGSRCCMLKNGNGTIIPNPWPKNVTTGYMTGFTPGPTPPFLPSLFLSNVVFGTPRSWNTSAGDTWPSAWASNGELYAWPCDSKDGPMSLKRIDGNPSDDIGLSAVSISNGTPLNYTQLCSSLGKTGSYPYINIKPAGMVALPPSTTSPLGTLIVGVSCMNYGDDVVFNRQHNLAGFIAESYDGGVTWTNTTNVGRLFIGRFSAPVFISCGQANIPCQEKDGDILYVFFPGSINNQAYWDNNDAMFLAQVPTDSRSDMTKYSFFAGLNDDNPLWTFDSLEAQPSVYFGNMIGENPVSYHPFLKRYLIANFGFIDNVGNPRPWHTEPFMSPHRTQLIILESKNPWGPWFLFYRSDDSGSFTPPAPGLYVPSFPSKFMTDINNGKIELCMIFACLDGSPSCLYTLNWINLTVTVNTTLL